VGGEGVVEGFKRDDEDRNERGVRATEERPAFPGGEPRVSDIILHHYPASPVSEKVRVALGIKHSRPTACVCSWDLAEA